MIRLYVSGAGTDVGKTYFCGLLAKYLLESGKTVRYVKPVQTGHPPDNDAAMVSKLSGLELKHAELLFSAPERVAPCFVFDPFPFQQAVDRINSITDCDVLLVESAGGLLVPLDDNYQNFHVAQHCNLEVMLVVPNRLGCLNDALLNCYFLQHEKIPFHGLAMNEHFENSPLNRTRNKIILQRLLPGMLKYTFDNEIST